MTRRVLIASCEQAGPDFEVWSRAFDLYCGYYRSGVNPFGASRR
jgi:hypothetical protein